MSIAVLQVTSTPVIAWVIRAATPREEWDLDPEELSDLDDRWDPLLGDRLTELVFIGVDPAWDDDQCDL